MASKNKKQPHTRLIQALTVSAALNVVLLGFLFHSWTKERPPIPYYVLKPVDEKKAADAISG